MYILVFKCHTHKHWLSQETVIANDPYIIVKLYAVILANNTLNGLKHLLFTINEIVIPYMCYAIYPFDQEMKNYFHYS